MPPLEIAARASHTSLLTDSFGRQIDYLRLALTDRCNLRCRYCMPADGIDLLPNSQLLRYEEIFRLIEIFGRLGMRKIRLTGGEPFVRRDAMGFFRQLLSDRVIPKVHITSNGTFIGPHLTELQTLGIDGINFSLDSLESRLFLQITRRDTFTETWQAILQALELGIPTKINMVVMAGVNDDEIEAFVRLTEKFPFTVRFIEQMPFNGAGRKTDFCSASVIESRLRQYFPEIERTLSPSNVARMYKNPGFAGQVGVIAAYSRTFCGSCDRIRLTPYGAIQTCLYGPAVLNLRDMIRGGRSDEEILRAIQKKMKGKPRDGFAAEAESRRPALPSMATIGG